MLAACRLAHLQRKRHKMDQAEQYAQAAAQAMEACGDAMPPETASYLSALLLRVRGDIARCERVRYLAV